MLLFTCWTYLYYEINYPFTNIYIYIFKAANVFGIIALKRTYFSSKEGLTEKRVCSQFYTALQHLSNNKHQLTDYLYTCAHFLYNSAYRPDLTHGFVFAAVSTWVPPVPAIMAAQGRPSVRQTT